MSATVDISRPVMSNIFVLYFLSLGKIQLFVLSYYKKIIQYNSANLLKRPNTLFITFTVNTEHTKIFKIKKFVTNNYSINMGLVFVVPRP